MRSGFLEAGGRRLEYAWHGPPPGEAPTLVFLHEGLGCVSLWRGFPARLAEATGLGALVYSRAGHGRSDPVPLPRPVSFMHDEALRVLPEVLDAAGVRDAVLVGHSDGASIALVHAGSGAAERVRALVLEAPHVFVEDVSVESIARIARAYRETDLRGKLARHHGANVDCAFLGWSGVWLDPEFRAWNVEEYLPRVAVPVLVVQGEADEYGTPAQVEAVRRRAGGPVETLLLPGVGHSPHRDAPEATLEAMARFVGRVAGGPRETLTRDRRGSMPDAKALFADFDQEMATTRALLERVPEDRADWSPHPRSTTLGALAVHIPSLVGLVATSLSTEELDMNPPGGGGFTPPRFTTTADLLATFDRKVEEARAALASATDDELRVPWSFKSGGHTIFTVPRAAVVRSMVISHVVHHRGQLSVYLRLNDVPLPSIYGPTADTRMGA